MRYQATGAKSSAFRKNAALAAVSAVGAGLFAGPALAAGTPAGTNITNVATATFYAPGTAGSTTITGTLNGASKSALVIISAQPPTPAGPLVPVS